MNLYVVCTRGCTASRWLSRSLEKLDGLECSHGTNALTDYESSEYTRDELIDCIHQEWFERQSMPVDEFLRSNVRDGDKVYSGNVHRYQVARHDALFQQAPSIPVANVVRHPVTWLDSRTALFRFLMEFTPHVGQQLHYTIVTNFDALRPFSKEFGVSLTDPEVMAFVANIAALYELEKDARLMERYPTFAMESLCSDRETFTRLVLQISGGRRLPTGNELDSVFGSGRLHQHRSVPERSEAETFAAWPAWKQRLSAPVLLCTGLAERYQSLGYDWSFLDGVPEFLDASVLVKPMVPNGPYWISVDDGE